MESMKVAATIIYQPNHYILQHRLNGVDVGEEDKYGLFGGQEEPGENPRQTVSREMYEESGVMFLPEAFEPMETIFASSERNGRNLLVEAHVHVLLLDFDFPVTSLKNAIALSTEGVGAARALGKLTPVASQGLSKVYGV